MSNKLCSFGNVWFYILNLLSLLSFRDSYPNLRREIPTHFSDSIPPGKCDRFIYINSEIKIQSLREDFSDTEAIFWNPPSANPGDFVLLKGNFSDSTREIELSFVLTSHSENLNKLVQKLTVKVSHVNSHGLIFQIPKEAPMGAYKIRLKPHRNISTNLNIPTIYWMMSKGASLSSKSYHSGDSLLIFGVNFPRAGYIAFSNTEQKKTIPFISQNSKSTSIIIPKSLTIGDFNFQIVSEFTGSSDITHITIVGQTLIQKININCSSLVGDELTDNSELLQTYLNQHDDGKNDYIFNIPTGKFLIRKPIRLYNHQYLKGIGKAETILIGSVDKDENSPLSWIRGQSDFGLLNLTFIAPVRSSLVSNFSNLKSLTPDSTLNKQNIILNNVIIKCTKHFDRFGSSVSSTSLVQLIGKSISIVNSEFDNSERLTFYNSPRFTDNTTITIIPIDGCVIENNKFRLGDWGLGLYVKSYKNVVIRNNSIEGTTFNPGASCGISLWSTKEIGNSENIFITENLISNIISNNRESITTDGGGGTYFGFVRSSTTTSTILQNEPGWGPWDKKLEPNSFLTVVTAGRGVGQIAFIKSFTSNAILLSTPWAIIPDSQSVVTIFLPQNHIQITKNTILRADPIQFYGGVVNSDISGNSLSNSLGINLYSGLYFCACEPLANITISDNIMFGKSTIDSIKTIGISVYSSPLGIISGLLIRKNSVVESTSRPIAEKHLFINGKSQRIFPMLIDTTN